MASRDPPPHITAMTDTTPNTTPSGNAPSGSDAAATDQTPPAAGPAAGGTDSTAKGPAQKPGEIGGPQGPEPTRYGDWEFKGRCSDF